MGYASRSGRAVTNPDAPRAFAVCDRCGFWTQHIKLQWQHEWAGTKLINLNILVCEYCVDKPQPQFRARILPPDPKPIRNPRPEWFAQNETDYLATPQMTPISGTAGNPLTIEPLPAVPSTEPMIVPDD